MPRQTQDSAGIIPLVCCELLTLAFAMAVRRMARMTGTITARKPDAQAVAGPRRPKVYKRTKRARKATIPP